MKVMVLAAALSLSAATAFAQGTSSAPVPGAASQPTCKARATEQNLRGAALKSFLTKCEKDAKQACEADSKQRKLAGAAKNSHMKKCVADQVGT